MLARKQNQGSRRGFTLIELLVVISIIGILASLILPAVVNARRQGRRVQCLNNMKNIGTGMFNYVTTKGKFPASGYWNVTNLANERLANPGTPADWHPNQLLTSATGWGWGRVDDGANFAGDPSLYDDSAGPTLGLKYSWVVELLPHIGSQNIYDAWDFTESNATGQGGNRGAYLDNTPGPGKRGNRDLANTYLEVLVCPEDVTSQQSQGSISYVVNGGFAPHWLASIPMNTSDSPSLRQAGSTATQQGGGWHRQNLFNMGLMFLDTTQGGTDANRRHTLESVRDGVSFTAMLSENINAGPGSQFGGGTMSSSWACPFPANTSFFVNPKAVFGGDPIQGELVVGLGSGEAGRYNYPQSNNRGTLAPPAFDDDDSTQGGINGDITGINEGQFPYPTSMHPGGVHVVMCDGNIRFIPENIAGEVWSRIITPNGGALTRQSGSEAARDRINFEQPPSGVSGTFFYGNRQVPLSESDIPSG